MTFQLVLFFNFEICTYSYCCGIENFEISLALVLTDIFVLCQPYWKDSSFVVPLQCGHSVGLILHIKHTELMLSQLALP